MDPVSGEASGYLVATPSGLWRLGELDDARRVEPQELAVRPGLDRTGGAGAVAVLDAAPESAIGVPIPVALWQEADGSVLAWDQRTRNRVPLSSSELALLAAGDVRTVADVLHRGDEAVAAAARLVDRGVWEVAADGVDATDRPLLQRSSGGPQIADPPPPDPGDHRIAVHPVCASPVAGLPLGLGDVVAAALAHDGGALTEHYAFRPIRNETGPVLDEVRASGRPVILLLSNYLWSVDDNLALVEEVKRLAPGSLAIHGGPSTPKYDGDAAAFFRAPHAPDVAVLAEGEATLPDVLERLGGTLDIERLAGVPGALVREPGGGFARGPERERIADLTVLPSPYLTGLFDHLDGGVLGLMTVETNRGCPYGCTFCDWGSATLSRIRMQSMERVTAELDWIAARNVGTLFIADANFGVMARDVDIAKHVADLRTRSGAPRAVLSSFAKNTVKHSKEIVQTWVQAGISTEGSVALQTIDPVTLDNISRRNIKIEKYDALAEEFRRLGLPVATDLMLGLPGATVPAFKADLQRCIDSDVTARIYPTVVLPNAPMNDPEYKERFRLVIDDDNVVVGTSSFDAGAYAEMLRVRRAFRAGEHFGVVRHLIRYVEHQTGMPAIDQLDAMSIAGRDDPERWPGLRWLTHHLVRWTVPPAGWEPLLAEVRAFAVTELGAPDEPGLDLVVQVQHALLPWPGRSFPDPVPLAHDYVRWYRSVLRPTGPDGPADLALLDLPPAVLEVRDPEGVCGRNRSLHLREHPHPELDSVIWNDFWIVDDWELDSPLARPLVSSAMAPDS